MNKWLVFALLTVLSWGVYGVLLHTARGKMLGAEPANAGLKAFLFVCVAYALIGVAAAAVLKMRGSNWQFGRDGGITWSLIAGTAGAAGAFTLVLALGAAAQIYKGAAAAYVMPIVFGGAPVVNTIVAMAVHPPEGGLKSIPVPFFLGCVLAVVGAILVAKFAPSNVGAAPKPVAHAASPSPSETK